MDNTQRTRSASQKVRGALQVGDTLDGRYEIVGALGSGGMAVVYKARHLHLERDMAIKVIRPSMTKRDDARSDMIRARFFKEARIAVQLVHRNIVQTREFGELPDDKGFFLAMDFCPGVSLLDLMRDEGQIRADRALPIACQVLDALSEAQRQGVVHRDIKPSNILVDEAGLTRVLDFGIAKIDGSDPDKPLTGKGVVVGTPMYMSPEQATGGEVDGRSDVYALGLILYELLTGELPFGDKANMEMLHARISRDAPSLRDARPDMSFDDRLEEIVRRALARDLEQRWPTAQAMLEALQVLLPEHPSRPSVPTLQNAPPTPVRGRPVSKTIDPLSMADTAAWVVSEPPLPPRPATKSSQVQRAALIAVALVLVMGAIAAVVLDASDQEVQIDPAMLRLTALDTFGTLPAVVQRPGAAPLGEAEIALGRTMFFDARLSKNRAVSCNTCHQLDNYGADGLATSRGAGDKRFERNTPSIYNVANHTSQRWDGSVPSLEEECKSPFTRPEGHALATGANVVAILASMPGYKALFEAAYPNESDPITFDNVGRAMASFVRTLTTRSRFDDFLEGDLNALRPEELRGLDTFIKVGCTTCHVGPTVGGTKTQKMGLIHAYATDDLGLYSATSKRQDRHVFKVAALRNVTETGPYLHDGSIETLEEVIWLMGHHQLDRDLDGDDVASIKAFFGSLMGPPAEGNTDRPTLPRTGDETPLFQ